jgi:hypothetical protein
MAGKRMKGMKVGKAAGAKRKNAKAAKKPRKPAGKSAATKLAATKRESLGSLDLLRSWSPSRYSTR